MSTTNTVDTIEILNDLVEIHNDRIQGYERALKELKEDDADLKSLFASMIAESHQHRLTLATEVQALGGDIKTGTTNKGKIYRVWMDVKAVFTGHDRHHILENCEFGEDAAQNAYHSALESEELPKYLREVVGEQQRSLKFSHDEIKSLRDQTA